MDGRLIGYCSIAVPADPGGPVPFPDEWNEWQAGFILCGSGRVRLQAQPGGDLNVGSQFGRWDPEAVLVDLAPDAGCDELTLELAPYAGRRAVQIAENRSGVLSGWHSRIRAWHAAPGRHATLLSLGICEQRGIIRGEDEGFVDILRAATRPSHFSYVADDACVPCAATLTEQLGRDDAACAEILADMTQGLLGGVSPPGAADFDGRWRRLRCADGGADARRPRPADSRWADEKRTA